MLAYLLVLDYKGVLGNNGRQLELLLSVQQRMLVLGCKELRNTSVCVVIITAM